MLAIGLIAGMIPSVLFSSADSLVSGLLLNVNFNEAGALTTGSPVIDNVVASKDGGSGVKAATVDAAGQGSLTYHFNGLDPVGKASVMVEGRGIIGAGITIKIKTGDAWQDVKTLGGPVEWGFENTQIIDISEFTTGKSEFDLQIYFDDGACGDWAMVRKLRVATTAAANTRTSGTVIQSDFSNPAWTAQAASGACFSDWSPAGKFTVYSAAYCRDKNADSYAVYKLNDLDPVDTMRATIDLDRKIGSETYVEILGSDDGVTYSSLYKSEMAKDLTEKVTVDLSAFAAGKTSMYLKLAVHDTQMGDWVLIKGFYVETVPAADSSVVSQELLNVNFNDAGSLTTGSPVIDNVVATKDGGSGVKAATVDEKGQGTLTYHFTGLAPLGKASAFLEGRGIIGAGVTVKIKTGDTWQDVGTLGGPAEWGFENVKILDLSEYVTGKTEFDLQIYFDDGACGDWAMVRKLRVAAISASNVNPSGTLVNCDFSNPGWIAEATSGAYFTDWKSAGKFTITDAGYTRDHNVNGEAVYKLSQLNTVDTMQAIINLDRKIGSETYIELLAGEDGNTYNSIYKSPMAVDLTGLIKVNLTDYAKGKTALYLKLVVHDTQMGDWVLVKGFQVVSTSAETVPDVPVIPTEPDYGPVSKELLNVNFNDAGALTTGNPVIDNVVASKDGGSGVKAATVDVKGQGSLTYHFSGLDPVGKASILTVGRGIIGASVTFRIKTGDTWQDVKKLGGTSDWCFENIQILDISEFIAGKTGFDLQVAFDDGSCGDWAMIRKLRVASITAGEVRQRGTLVNTSFADPSWIAAVTGGSYFKDQNPNGYLSIVDAGYTRDHNLNGEVIYKLSDLATVDTMKATIDLQRIIGSETYVELFGSADGETYTSLYKSTLGVDLTGPVTVDLTSFAKSKILVYLKLAVHDTQMGDWVMVKGLKVESTSKDPVTDPTAGVTPGTTPAPTIVPTTAPTSVPTPEPTTAPVKEGTVLLNVDFTKADWASQATIYEQNNMQWKSWDAGTGIMPNIKAGEACATEGGYIVYKLENVKPEQLVLYATHRSCNATEVNFQFSSDGVNYSKIASVTQDHLNMDKPFEVDLSKAAIGSTTLYIKAAVPSNACYDWGVIQSLKLVNYKADIQQTYLMSVDYSKEDWASQYPYESMAGLKRDKFERSTNNFVYGLYNDGTVDAGTLVYKISNVSADAVLVLLNNRACSGTKTVISTSTDGAVYTEIMTVTSENLDLGKPLEIDVTDAIAGNSSFYLKVTLPKDGCLDWNVLSQLKVLAQTGNVIRKYNITVKGNNGGTVEATEKVEAGQNATVKASPASGYTFLGWFDQDYQPVSTEANYTFVPEADTVLIARFVKKFAGEGTVVLDADYNDLAMNFLSDAYDYDNITVMLDDGLRVSGKYGQELVRADVDSVGSLVYKFNNTSDWKQFKAVVAGRAIMKSTVTFQVSEDGNSWTNVKDLGGPSSLYDFGYDTEQEIDFIKYIQGKSEFYIRIQFNVGGLQDWATLRYVKFIADGAPANETIIPEYANGVIGKLANTASEGLLLDQKIDLDNYADKLYSAENMYVGEVTGNGGTKTDGLMVMDMSTKGEIIWKFDNLKALTSFKVTLEGRAVQEAFILMRVSTDGVDWKPITGGLLDSVNGTAFDVGTPVVLDMINRVSGSHEVYLKAVFSSSSSTDRAFLTGIKVECTGTGTVPTEDSSSENSSEDSSTDASVTGSSDGVSQDQGSPATGDSMSISYLFVFLGMLAFLGGLFYNRKKIQE